MADFLPNLWESVFTPGTTPTLLIATNVTFGALQLVLAALLYATLSVHFVALSVLCAGLWWSINWFAVELGRVKAEEESEAREKRETDDEGEDTEVEGLGGSQGSLKRGVASGSQAVGGGSGSGAKLRVRDEGEKSGYVSTDSEWEKVEGDR